MTGERILNIYDVVPELFMPRDRVESEIVSWDETSKSGITLAEYIAAYGTPGVAREFDIQIGDAKKVKRIDELTSEELIAVVCARLHRTPKDLYAGPLGGPMLSTAESIEEVVMQTWLGREIVQAHRLDISLVQTFAEIGRIHLNRFGGEV